MDVPIVHVLIPALAAITLTGLLFVAERTGNQLAKWIFKPATSGLFLLAAFQQGPQQPYDWLIVCGLLLSAIGDVALIPPGRRWLLAGLAAFLLGHVAYTVAFASRPDAGALHPLAWLGIALTSVAVYAYLRPHLGPMRRPVIAYILVITVMLGAAWSVAAGEGTGTGGRIALAAALFYLSDITVARARFIPGTGFGNRLAGLPLYYAAQFLFAYTIGR